MLSDTSFLTPLYAGEDYIAPSGYRHKTVVCRCELCGTIKTVMVSNLPRTKSCGCAKLQFIREANSTHGESKTRLYRIWSLMKDRCTNPNAEHYDLYGGRGIAVCDEWLQADVIPVTRSFYKDMAGSLRLALYNNGEAQYFGDLSGLSDEILSNWGDYVGMVCEVGGMEIDAESGHIRHPKFIRWRDDKMPQECNISQVLDRMENV